MLFRVKVGLLNARSRVQGKAERTRERERKKEREARNPRLWRWSRFAKLVRTNLKTSVAEERKTAGQTKTRVPRSRNNALKPHYVRYIITRAKGSVLSVKRSSQTAPKGFRVASRKIFSKPPEGEGVRVCRRRRKRPAILPSRPMCVGVRLGSRNALFKRGNPEAARRYDGGLTDFGGSLRGSNCRRVALDHAKNKRDGG